MLGIKASTEKEHESEEEQMEEIKEEINEEQMPPSQSMVLKLIVIRVYKKLIKNPNLWASVLGIIWALIAARYFPTLSIFSIFFRNSFILR